MIFAVTQNWQIEPFLPFAKPYRGDGNWQNAKKP
jgi:hypothetical protein